MLSQTAKQIGDGVITPAKPILKWAGGKKQLLGDILPKVPTSYGRYVEPFFGGGALFFALQPEDSIIADSNPELINMYRQVADHVDEVIFHLLRYENTKEIFYEVRGQDWTKMKPDEAAARMIFLNKTCFNGLYRVNRKGQFNVPYGKYKNPTICDAEALYAASAALKKAQILCGDYMLVLEHNAQPGDLIFLDPPYLPISAYSDFKRYTKEQFYEEDHRELANEVTGGIIPDKDGVMRVGAFIEAAVMYKKRKPRDQYSVPASGKHKHASCCGSYPAARTGAVFFPFSASISQTRFRYNPCSSAYRQHPETAC